MLNYTRALTGSSRIALASLAVRYDYRNLYTTAMSGSAPFVVYAPPILAAFDPSDSVWFCRVWCRGPQGVYYEKAIRFRRWAADHVQSLIEGTYGRKMKAWGGVVDNLINNVVFETRDLHLRQERKTYRSSI